MSELICTGYTAISTPQVVGWDRQPSWLVADPVSGLFYALGEESEGHVGAFRRTANGWELVGTQPTLGAYPCHATLIGRELVVAHYGDGVVTSLTLSDRGALSPAELLVDESDGAHAHCVTPVGSGELLITDLGLARITWGRLPTASTPWAVLGELNLDVTAGPRHVALHPTLPLAYLITEYSNELLTIALGPQAGALHIRDRRPTLPAGWTGTSFGSGVRVSPDGRFVLAGNRGHDSLVSWALDDAGVLGQATHVPCGGTWPRDVVISDDGTRVAVANQKSGAVQVFARHIGNGALVPEAGPLAVEGAASVLFI